jgi:hypothetical protein
MSEKKRTDHPGRVSHRSLERADARERDVIQSYEFTAEQIIYSPGAAFKGDPKRKNQPDCECEKNDEVAKKGPHTATVTGPVPKLKHLGVPADL